MTKFDSEATKRRAYPSFSNAYFQRGLAVEPIQTNSDLGELINDFSNPVVWQRVAQCPNVRSVRGSAPVHLENCQYCLDSQRYVYEEKEIRVVIQDLSMEQQFYWQGQFVGGMLKIMFPPDHRPAFWDRVQLIDESIDHSEVRYIPQNGSQVFALRFKPIAIERILVVVQRDLWPLPTIPPGYQDQQTAMLVLKDSEKDFKILDDQRVLVVPTLPPATALTIVYKTTPTFVIIDRERTALHGHPSTVLARLQFFVEQQPDLSLVDHYANDTGERLVRK